MKKNNKNINLKHYAEYFKKDIYFATALTVLFIPLILDVFVDISIRPLRIMEFWLFIGVLGGTLSYQFFLKNFGNFFLSFARKFQLTYFFVLLLFGITHIRNNFAVFSFFLMFFSVIISILTYKLFSDISDELTREKRIQLQHHILNIFAILTFYILHNFLSGFVTEYL